jgi:Tfp pilus assembly protein PilX
MNQPNRSASQIPRDDRGIALILVMLALLVLATMAAAIVFSARSETLASYNYKLNTQADYLAKAGLQQAVNWFRSSAYQAVSAAQVPTYYNVAPDSSGLSLYTSNSTPVQCIGGCTVTSGNNGVQLIGIPGTGSSNYPSINNAAGQAVATEFANDLVNVRVTADANNSGTFSVNAVLLSYQTVNAGTPPNLNDQPVEIWLITSQGTWTGSSGQSTALATVVEQAVIQPVYTPSYGDALYGYCSVTMNGSAGVCTDSFNSAYGQYGGANKSVASGQCDSASTNVIASGAGVGANGGVTLGSNVTVAGDVTIGTDPSAGCTADGYSGSTSSVLGQVIDGPHQDPPPLPTFRTGFPGSSPSYSGSQVLPAGATWPSNTSTFPFSLDTKTPPTPQPAPPLPQSGPCMDASCNGSAAHPYEINSISINGNTTTIQLIGGPDLLDPVYYDIDSLSESGKAVIDVSGYVVLNVRSSMSITGNGITNGITDVANIPPAAVQINYAGTSGVSLGGNGAVSAVITAPNATVTLGGGGSGGYLVGSIKANNIVDQGGYPVHYDLQLDRLGGTISVPVVAAYSRPKI